MRNYRADQFRRPSVISKSMQMTVFIAPLFNKFRPLEDPELRSRIEALLARNGFSITDFLVMDGSLRSTHGNAYFTGFGKNKRVVFFDTLLTDLKPAEIESVLVAYELGHFKCTHVLLQSLPGVAGVWPRATPASTRRSKTRGQPS